MSMDSTLPSPSSLSSASLGFEGLPGRRRKKRTSIETNVRVALERSFIAVRTRRWPGRCAGGRPGLGSGWARLRNAREGGETGPGSARCTHTTPRSKTSSFWIQRFLYSLLSSFGVLGPMEGIQCPSWLDQSEHRKVVESKTTTYLIPTITYSV